ncbi:hypothetical protein C4D60_Mb05t03370 [Musa balbisiana]|uniref:Uncharacterized protein n=1 Tax=Musa balbisiana TaxID=52838 RepID=A0A4S8JTD2_MUSBA|nr:hypothetical protein C4D60_Mb05t03370 [Musa balbisiana]
MIASRSLTRVQSPGQSSETNVSAVRPRASVIGIPSGVSICGAFVLDGSRLSVALRHAGGRTTAAFAPLPRRRNCSTTSMASERSLPSSALPLNLPKPISAAPSLLANCGSSIYGR